MAVWIDIENPPQVQYLCPFVTYLESSGSGETIVTVRKYGTAVELVRNKGIDAVVLGRQAGPGKLSKVFVTLQRAFDLVRYIKREGCRPSYLICSSRSASVAARVLGIPTFSFCDYEFADLRLSRIAGAILLYPDVIDTNHFRSLGFKDKQLLPFPGIKEDISFAYTDFAQTAPLELPFDNEVVRVLLRPPATSAHYYVDSSGKLYEQILQELPKHKNIQIVFSPRYPEQAEALLNVPLHHRPIILDNKADFIALLKSVDVVISSGGTMLREAAYLGIPAYSIFMGAKGGVDLHLSEQGLLTFVRSIEDFRKLEFKPKSSDFIINPNPEIIEKIICEIEKVISR